MIDGTPEPPDQLTPAARQIWRAYAPVYGITVADQPLFVLFCDSYARWQELIAKANEVGAIVVIKGAPCTNPNLARADKEAANYKHALAMLLRNKHSERDHDGDDENEAEENPNAIAELRSLLLTQLTGDGDEPEGSAEDRQPVAKRQPAKVKATAPRPVRPKKAT